ncbi:hypothetical protein EDB83DRAFT_2319718 [Lactarius deliciosus]|nr:hypothetical protein EDB83DRAFT_2319718 [Lactarius deliciosus]
MPGTTCGGRVRTRDSWVKLAEHGKRTALDDKWSETTQPKCLARVTALLCLEEVARAISDLCKTRLQHKFRRNFLRGHGPRGAAEVVLGRGNARLTEASISTHDGRMPLELRKKEREKQERGGIAQLRVGRQVTNSSTRSRRYFKRPAAFVTPINCDASELGSSAIMPIFVSKLGKTLVTRAQAPRENAGARGRGSTTFCASGGHGSDDVASCSGGVTTALHLAIVNFFVSPIERVSSSGNKMSATVPRLLTVTIIASTGMGVRRLTRVRCQQLEGYQKTLDPLRNHWLGVGTVVCLPHSQPEAGVGAWDKSPHAEH